MYKQDLEGNLLLIRFSDKTLQFWQGHSVMKSSVQTERREKNRKKKLASPDEV